MLFFHAEFSVSIKFQTNLIEASYILFWAGLNQIFVSSGGWYSLKTICADRFIYNNFICIIFSYCND